MATDELTRTAEGERVPLLGVAFRMLGTVADAEDAVQEAYVRWYRLPEEERAAVRVPGAWLSRTVSRICLDMLGSARARRESYVGEWLPEPVPHDSPIASAPPTDPLDRVTLDEAVSTALLVVLDTLTPAERVAFVLHDVFGMGFAEIAEILGRSAEASRQLASSARRRVRERREGRASHEAHDALVAAFAHACATGDLSAVTALLAPDVILRSDGGGAVSAARRPVVGADRVARFILGLPRLQPTATLEPTRTPDGLGFVTRVGGLPYAVWTLGVRGERITEVWIVVNPAKLTLWD